MQLRVKPSAWITISGLSPAWTLSTARNRISSRSEEHTSELQSLRHLVCRLLLEKNKHRTPLHVLSQQIFAMTAMDDGEIGELERVVRRVFFLCERATPVLDPFPDTPPFRF